MTSVTTTSPSNTTVLPHPDSAGHPALNGAQITHVTSALRTALIELGAYLDPPGAALDPDGAACEALRLVVAAAYDTAEPGEELGLLFVTPSVAQLGHRPVWLRRRRDGSMTAGFPADHR
ncbi:hypothetical protein AB0K51_24005 [Kitasatospora sp. NPDC049285]|uniref:hypothetical protein n=1 Tax=Kitasatospora sp. NPDC049285 TaxID=3157096 RepID=UPI00342A7BA7